MRVVLIKQAWKTWCRMRAAGSGARRRAFTLMELLVVITIMIFIATITLINVFGSMRAAAYVGVGRDVYGALMNARQHACQTGNRTHFFLIDSNKFVRAYSIGTITSISGSPANTFWDQYANLDKQNAIPFQGVEIFDLDASATAYISSSKLAGITTNFNIIDGVNVWIPGSQSPPYTNTALQMTVWATASNSAAPVGWNVNDHYAIEAGEEQELPRGFYFDKNGSFAPVDPTQPLNSFEFMPDGSVMANGTGNGIQMISGSPGIVIYEDIKSGNTKNLVRFTIDSSGHIVQIQ
jgi:type II secretory pathway pseudopilin PulG